MKELLYALPGGGDGGACARWGLTPAHMTYRVAPGPRLTGVGLTPQVQEGAMLLAASGALDGDPQPCCRQVVGECRRRRFTRVVCDFEGPPAGGLERLAAALAASCAQAGLTLYLPEAFASLVPGCRTLVSSAIVSGTLERRLTEAIGHYGLEQVTLAVEAVAEDFLLPASGRGEPLTPEQLRRLIDQLSPAVFFDRGLCAHYFTYMARGSQAHFIIYDTARSVQEKLSVAQRLGIPSALLAAPQVGEWLETLFGPPEP